MYDRYMRATVSIREYDDDGNIVEPTTSRAEDRANLAALLDSQRAFFAAMEHGDPAVWTHAMTTRDSRDDVQRTRSELSDLRADGPYADPAAVREAERAHHAACRAVAHRLADARRKRLTAIRERAASVQIVATVDTHLARRRELAGRERDRMHTGVIHTALVAARTTTQRAAAA